MGAATIPSRMAAVLLTGHGGHDRLEYREDVPVPLPAAGEVLIRVRAAGINNTDINTRTGWYSSSGSDADGAWTGSPLAFPRIQGADVCGIVVAAGSGVEPSRIGERVIVQSCLRSQAEGDFIPWLGSERDGGFAEFVIAPAADTYAVRSELSDAQLAAVPCAFATAENLLTRAGVASGERVLITGASGNVGFAAIQLARRRGAEVTAIAAPGKFSALEAAGASRLLARGAALTGITADVIIDVVGGPQWPELLDVLVPRGRYAASGAIAGPEVILDLRKLYLRDLTLHGCTAQAPEVFPNLVGYLERGEITPLVAMEFPLQDIVQAQEVFLSKQHVGKIVLVPE